MAVEPDRNMSFGWSTPKISSSSGLGTSATLKQMETREYIRGYIGGKKNGSYQFGV